MRHIYLGIDPGLKGALGAIDEFGGLVDVVPMPVLAGQIDLVGLNEFIAGLRAQGVIVRAMVEKACVMPKQSSTSGLTIGLNYARLTTALELYGVPLQEIHPSSWKKGVVVIPKGTQKPQAKAIAVVTARRLFPAAGLSSQQDGLAEALLIAERLRRSEVGSAGAGSLAA